MNSKERSLGQTDSLLELELFVLYLNDWGTQQIQSIRCVRIQVILKPIIGWPALLMRMGLLRLFRQTERTPSIRLLKCGFKQLFGLVKEYRTLRKNQQNMNYYGSSYFDIISHIANYLGTGVYIKRSQLKEQYFYAYRITANTKLAQSCVRAYQDRYTQLSSKQNDYKDWCTMIDLAQDLSIPKIERIKGYEMIKANTNTQRTKFNWSHHESPWDVEDMRNKAGFSVGVKE